VPILVKIGQNVVEIFRFFNMAAATILDFSNLKFLTVKRLKGVELRHQAKFGRNRSNRCRDMAIYFIFTRWRPSAILDLLCVCSDHPRRAFGGLYHVQNLVGINAVVLIICMFFDFTSLA